MARKTRLVPQEKKSILAQKLEAGEPIKDLVGYILITSSSADEDDDAQIAVKVRCIGLDAAGCGLKINVMPVSGEGIFDITPCRWYDSIETVKKAREISRRIKQAKEHMNRYHRFSFCASRRKALLEEIEQLPEEQKALFEVDWTENGISKSKLTDSQIGQYLIKFVKIIYDIQDQDISLPYSWGR